MSNREYGEPLWVETIPRVLGEAFDWASRQVGVSPDVGRFASVVPAPYRYVTALIAFNLLLYPIQYYDTGSAVILDNPSWIALPITVFLGTFTNRYLRDRYDAALRKMRIDQRTRNGGEAFRRLTPPSFKRNLLVATLVVYYGYVFASGRIATVAAYEGATGLVGWLILAPFGYAPILIETVAIYLSLHGWVPRLFEAHEVKIDFLDTDNLGGLRPMGELLKHSYYLFTAALTLFTTMFYLPFVFPRYLFTPYYPPDYVVTSLVLLLWSAGVLSTGYSFWELHKYMRRERRASLQRCERRLAELVPSRYDLDRTLEVEGADRGLDTHLRFVEQAQKTREFPVTVSMWAQIGASAVLPLVVELLLRALVGGL